MRMTVDMRKQIIDLYRKGVMQKDIALNLGCSQATVSRVVYAMAPEIRRPSKVSKPLGINAHEIVELRKAGLYQAEIAAIFGCSQSHVSKVISEMAPDIGAAYRGCLDYSATLRKGMLIDVGGETTSRRYQLVRQDPKSRQLGFVIHDRFEPFNATVHPNAMSLGYVACRVTLRVAHSVFVMTNNGLQFVPVVGGNHYWSPDMQRDIRFADLPTHHDHSVCDLPYYRGIFIPNLAKLTSKTGEP